MPNWKKLITSGSDASLSSLFVANAVTASAFSGSFTGSLLGTASWANNATTASFVANAFIQGGNSFGTTATLGTNDTQNLALETNGSVRMTISSSGYIGVGTATPSANIPVAALDVNGLIRARSGIQIMGDNGITSVVSASRSDNSQYGTLVFNGWGDFAFNKSLYLGYTPPNTGAGNGYLFAQGGIGINKTGSLNGSFDVNGGATISGSLNVTNGITGSLLGTASFALTSSNILGGAANYVARWANLTTLTTGSIYDNGTNVGIGTTSPNYKLHLHNSAANDNYIQITGNGTGTATTDGFILGVNTTNDALLLNRESSNMYFYTSNAIKMTLDSSGNVGIGTTSPSQKLEVVGTLRITNILSSSKYNDLATDVNGYLSFQNVVYTSGIGSGNGYVNLFQNYILVGSSSLYGFTSTNNSGPANLDASISRLSPSTLAIGNGTNGNTSGTLVASAFSGSLFGTASWANNATTSSYVLNAVSASFASTASSADNFLVRGTLTAQTIVAQTITSSTDFVTGSTRFGSLLANTHQFTGSVSMTGSLTVTGAGITGSLFGTSSWANNAITSSYVLNAVSASFASTSSNILGGAANYIPLWNSSTTLSSSVMYQSSNKIGIGTTTVNDILVVSSGSGAGEIRFGGSNGRTLSAYAGGTLANFDFYAVQTYFNSDFLIASGKKISTGNGSNGNLYLTADGTGIVYTDKNLGIGTTSPSYRLDIVSSGSLGSVSGSQVLSQRIQASTGNNDYLEITNTRVVNGSDWTSAGFRIQQKVDATWMGYIQFNGNSNNYGISFGTGNATTSAIGVTEKMRIDSSGNVGIGTTSPLTKLHISGSATTASLRINRVGGLGSIYGDNDLILETDSNFYIGAYAARPLSINSANGASGTVYVTEAGLMGIGTTSPSTKLHVSGGNSTLHGVIVGDDQTYGSPYKVVSFGNNADGNNRIFAATNTADGMYFAAATGRGFSFRPNGGTSDLVIINSSGNVGIGTTSPANKLHVSGGRIIIDDTLANQSAIQFNSAGTEMAVLYRPATTNTQIRLYTTLGGDVMTWSGSNVGIGTTTPSQKLDVNGIAVFGTNTNRFTTIGGSTGTNYIQGESGGWAFSWSAKGSSGTDRGGFGWLGGSNDLSYYWIGGAYNAATMYITSGSDGKVGIGTASPTNKLHVAGDTYVTGVFSTLGGGTNILAIRDASIEQQNSTSDSGAIYINYYGYNGSNTYYRDLSIHDGKGSQIAFFDGSTSRVGILQSNPAHALDVTGNIHATSTVYVDASNAAYLRGGDDHEFWDVNIANTAGLYGVQNSAVGALKLGSGGPVLYGAGGSLGINSTSPGDAKLYVEGRSANWDESAPGTGLGTIHLDPGVSTNNYGNAITFGASDNADGANAQAGIYVRSDDSYGTKMYIATTDNYSAGSKTRIFVNSNGTVGINTTSPGAIFQVNSSISNAGSQVVRIATSVGGANTVTDAMHIDHAGSNFNQGVAIALGYKDATYGSYYSRIVNYTDTGVTQATKLQLQTQAGGGTSWNTGILIDTTGKVGINTTNPGYALDVAGVIALTSASISAPFAQRSVYYNVIYEPAGNVALYLGNDSSPANYYDNSNHFFRSRGGGTSYMTIDSDGEVGIGTTSPTDKLTVAGNLFLSGSGRSVWLGNNADSGNRLRLHQSGIYSYVDFHSGDLYFRADTTIKVSLSPAGTITAVGDIVAYGTPSDISFKTNIVPIQGSLNKIQKLEPVSFTWKEETPSNKLANIKDDIGFIAQQVQEVLPELVRENDDKTLSLRERGIIPLLVGAIKELKAEIDILKNK